MEESVDARASTRHQASDRTAFSHELGLVVRPGALGPAAADVLEVDGRVEGERLADSSAVLGVVAGETEAALDGFEQTQHEVDRSGIEQPSTVMTALRPGVGKVDVDGAGKTRRQEGRREVERFAAEQDEVAEMATRCAVSGKAEVPARELDSKIRLVDVRRGTGGRDEVPALAEAEFDLPVGPGREQSEEVRATRAKIEELGCEPPNRRRQHGQSKSRRLVAWSDSTTCRTSWARSRGSTSTASPA